MFKDKIERNIEKTGRLEIMKSSFENLAQIFALSNENSTSPIIPDYAFKNIKYDLCNSMNYVP